MAFRVRKCLTSILCVPRPFKMKTFTIRHHIMEEILFPLSENIMTNKNINNNNNKSIVVRGPCGEKIPKKTREGNKIRTGDMTPFNDEISSLFGKIFLDTDGKRPQRHIQNYSKEMLKTDNLKRFQSDNIAMIKQRLKTNSVPPLSDKIFVSVQVELKVKTDNDCKDKHSKVAPKCPGSSESSGKKGSNPKKTNSSKESSSSECMHPCQPKSK